MAATDSALNRIERAHKLYREGKHEEALDLYSQALNSAKSKPQKIALHSNRAACFLKLRDHLKAAEECTAVLELDHEHTGALMLRAQTLVHLKNYQSALFDVNRLIELNPNSEVYHNLHDRLKTQLALAPIPESQEEDETETEEDENKEKKTNLPLIKPELNVQKKTDLPLNKTGEWEAIPKPKGHSGLDYSRWDKVLDGSSDEETGEDEDDEDRPQYRFRVQTVGVRPVK